VATVEKKCINELGVCGADTFVATTVASTIALHVAAVALAIIAVTATAASFATLGMLFFPIVFGTVFVVSFICVGAYLDARVKKQERLGSERQRQVEKGPELKDLERLVGNESMSPVQSVGNESLAGRATPDSSDENMAQELIGLKKHLSGEQHFEVNLEAELKKLKRFEENLTIKACNEFNCKEFTVTDQYCKDVTRWAYSFSVRVDNESIDFTPPDYKRVDNESIDFTPPDYKKDRLKFAQELTHLIRRAYISNDCCAEHLIQELFSQTGFIVIAVNDSGITCRLTEATGLVLKQKEKKIQFEKKNSQNFEFTYLFDYELRDQNFNLMDTFPRIARASYSRDENGKWQGSWTSGPAPVLDQPV